MILKPDATFKMSDNVVTRKEKEFLLVFNRTADELFVLNPVGAELLKLCRKGHSVSEVAHLIAEQYDVNEEVASQDATELIEELLSNGIIQKVR